MINRTDDLSVTKRTTAVTLTISSADILKTSSTNEPVDDGEYTFTLVSIQSRWIHDPNYDVLLFFKFDLKNFYRREFWIEFGRRDERRIY